MRAEERKRGRGRERSAVEQRLALFALLSRSKILPLSTPFRSVPLFHLLHCYDGKFMGSISMAEIFCSGGLLLLITSASAAAIRSDSMKMGKNAPLRMAAILPDPPTSDILLVVAASLPAI